MASNSKSDSEIISRIKRGDEIAFKILYEKYWEQLFISAYNLIKHREVCEDILQEIFIKIWNNREKIEIKTSLKSYLYTSVLYKVYDQFRKDKGIFKEELFENYNNRIQITTPESKLIQKELEAQLNTSIEKLPEKSKIVFKLSRMEQMSHKEIAEQLNISTKTVEAHITKSLKILRSLLANATLFYLLIYINRCYMWFD